MVDTSLPGINCIPRQTDNDQIRFILMVTEVNATSNESTAESHWHHIQTVAYVKAFFYVIGLVM